MELDGEVVFADYRRNGSILIITWVEAPPRLRGTGAADRLMRGIASIAENRGWEFRRCVVMRPVGCAFATDEYEHRTLLPSRASWDRAFHACPAVEALAQSELGNGRYCYPLTVTDHATRFLLLCEALESTREDLAVTAFQRLFAERGLPLAIRSDNGVPFASPNALLRPQKVLAVCCPAELYAASTRPYLGLPDLAYPYDRDVLVTACGRICMHRKRVNISTVLAGQRLGIKEVHDGIWLVSFMRYDLGYIDLEQKTLQPLDNPFGPRLSPIS